MISYIIQELLLKILEGTVKKFPLDFPENRLFGQSGVKCNFSYILPQESSWTFT
jgi:hypothetical protein